MTHPDQSPLPHPPYGAPLVSGSVTAPVRTGPVLSGRAVARLTAEIGPLRHFVVQGVRGREDRWDGCDMDGAPKTILGWPVTSVTERITVPDGEEQLYLTLFVDLGGQFFLLYDAVCFRRDGAQYRSVVIERFASFAELGDASARQRIRWATGERMRVLERVLDTAAQYTDFATMTP